MTATATAVGELYYGNINFAGPQERWDLVLFLARVTLVPDSPSAKMMSLKLTGNIQANDKLIFGTGDQFGLQTVTGNAKFLSGAAAQGVFLFPLPMVLPAPRYSGR